MNLKKTRNLQSTAILSIAAALVIGGALWGFRHKLWKTEPHASNGEASLIAHSNKDEVSIMEVDADGGFIQLSVPEEILQASGARWSTIESSAWNDERVIPAKLAIDPARHYAVTAPADVIVEELLCPLGTVIEKGDPLLEMSSSQLTTLRGTLVRQQLLTQKAQKAVDWNREIQTRVNEIVQTIEASMENPDRDWLPPSSVQTADYGAKILSAYAKYWAAIQISQISERASNSGVLAEKAMVERLTDRESAKVTLRGAIEQSRFDVQQAILTAESELAAAEGSLQSTQADIRKYLGMKNWDAEQALKLAYPDVPDRFVHNSPGRGMILERYFANGERASTGELVVLVADIASLWLVGDLRQQDWDLLQVKKGDAVQAEIVGLESLGRLPATVEVIGGMVQTNSGSIQLTASISNNELRFRPGMIARLIFSRPKHGLVVPSSAVFTNNGIDYIVVREVSENESTSICKVTRVEIGRRAQDSMEIVAGIHSGANVLVEGVFPIASQAFLEKE